MREYTDREVYEIIGRCEVIKQMLDSQGEHYDYTLELGSNPPKCSFRKNLSSIVSEMSGIEVTICA
jgi:hypothetical protein